MENGSEGLICSGQVEYVAPRTSYGIIRTMKNMPPERAAPRCAAIFMRLKQHLKIKAFYGYSENAVRTQLWIAVAVYCLLAIIKKELKADRELHGIQEILSVSVFQKMPILQAFSRMTPNPSNSSSSNQLSLF